MPLSRDELDDNHWAMITAALGIKQDDAQITDPNQAVLLFKKHWKLLCDKDRLERYVEEETLFRLKQARQSQDESRAIMDAQIAELEAKYPQA